MSRGLCHLQSDPRALCGLGTACVCPAPTSQARCAWCAHGCLSHVLPERCDAEGHRHGFRASRESISADAGPGTSALAPPGPESVKQVGSVLPEAQWRVTAVIVREHLPGLSDWSPLFLLISLFHVNSGHCCVSKETSQLSERTGQQLQVHGVTAVPKSRASLRPECPALSRGLPVGQPLLSRSCSPSQGGVCGHPVPLPSSPAPCLRLVCFALPLCTLWGICIQVSQPGAAGGGEWGTEHRWWDNGRSEMGLILLLPPQSCPLTPMPAGTVGSGVGPPGSPWSALSSPGALSPLLAVEASVPCL